VPLAWVLAGGHSKLVATDPAGVAIKGYDTVAYFTEGKAVKGRPEFASLFKMNREASENKRRLGWHRCIHYGTHIRTVSTD